MASEIDPERALAIGRETAFAKIQARVLGTIRFNAAVSIGSIRETLLTKQHAPFGSSAEKSL